MIDAALPQVYAQALRWYLDQGVDEALGEAAIDRMLAHLPVLEVQKPATLMPAAMAAPAPQFLGTNEALGEAVRLARAAQSLEALRAAIATFEGIALKRTATHLVFADGNPKARVMIIGEAPGADEDRLGLPFVGVSGQLLDKMLGAIGLDRRCDEPEKSVYISNILNWRPPGNRTPSPAEIALSLPFIERHIQLVQPRLLILSGAVAAQALLGRSDSVSRLRRISHTYTPLTDGLRPASAPPQILAMVTYHPSYLLRTPAQKRAAWGDLLDIAQKIALFT